MLTWEFCWLDYIMFKKNNLWSQILQSNE
jgi:hypothetical protein